MHKRACAWSLVPLLALPFAGEALTWVYLLLVVSSTTRAHIPRLAASKLTRFIPVLTFTCPQIRAAVTIQPAGQGTGLTCFLHGLLIWGELLTCPGGTRN